MDDIDLEDTANWPKSTTLPDLPGGKGYKRSFIMDRAFECLGSERNDQVFMIVEKSINTAKKGVGPPFFFFLLLRLFYFFSPL